MAGIDLGSLIQGQMADDQRPQARTPAAPKPTAPATSPKPTARPDAVRTAALGSAEADGKSNPVLSQYLADPRVRAGLLQMGVNLLSGQNIGEAVGGGLAATGRAGEVARDQEQADIENALKNAKDAKALAGGSGSGKAASTKLVKKWKGLIDEALTPILADSLSGEAGIPGFTSFNRQKLAEIASQMEGQGIDPTNMLNVAASGSWRDTNTEDQFVSKVAATLAAQ